jgi:prophage antirepressor-like protein
VNNRGEYFVTETGLYGLILGSRKKEAKDFKKWAKQTIRQLREKAGIEAYEAFRMMDKEVQKKCSTFIAENGNIGEAEDNIIMNKNVNELTSRIYKIEPPVKKGEMEKYHPEMLIDRQKVLNDYCVLFGYTHSHKDTKNMMLSKIS